MTDEQIKQEAENWSTFNPNNQKLFQEGFVKGAKWMQSQPNPVVEKLKELRDEYDAICKMERRRHYVNPQGTAYLNNCERIIEQLNKIIES